MRRKQARTAGPGRKAQRLTINQDKDIAWVYTPRHSSRASLNKALYINQKTASAVIDALAELDTNLHTHDD
jgi:hypothetical protein